MLADYKHLETTLRGISDVNAGVNGQIYRDMADANAVMPYCVINLNSGGSTNRALRFREFDNVWTIKFVGLRYSHATLMRTWAGLVYEALHETIPGDVDSSHLYEVTHEAFVDYIERDGDVVYLHTGGNYRVRMTK